MSTTSKKLLDYDRRREAQGIFAPESVYALYCKEKKKQNKTNIRCGAKPAGIETRTQGYPSV